MQPACDLSFCIPTYNFAAFIGETLDSIIQQADDRVQIVIVDGGSTDNTAQIVAEKARSFPNIKFIQRPQRCGVDLDILESVAQADGEFCWLFSSDDLLAPGAVAFLRRQMQDDWNVFLTNFQVCDLNMQRLERHRIIDVESLATFDWSDSAERSQYLALAETTTAFFSFISGIVVRRSSWNSVPQQTEFVGSCWIIAAQLFALARDRLTVRYNPGELVLKRGGNDSFMSGGIVNRMALSIDGFRRVAEHYFGAGSPEARQVSRVLKHEYFLLFMVIHKLQIDERLDPALVQKFDALARRHYSDGLFQDFLSRNIVLVPNRGLRTLLWFHHRIKPLRRVGRVLLSQLKKWTIPFQRAISSPPAEQAERDGPHFEQVAKAGKLAGVKEPIS